MKRPFLFVCLLIVTGFYFSNCNDQASGDDTKDSAREVMVKEEGVAYNDDTVALNGYIAYDESIESARPAVLIIPEWWGLTEYPKMRARELAKLGYVAFAIDMYGEGKTVDSPSQAGALAMPYYQDPAMAKSRVDAALKKLLEYSQVDSSKIAAIGYCFGGAMVLNVARLGEDFDAVVSFHGNLVGTPADKKKLKAKILVCHGAADQFVPKEEVDQFKKQMDSIGADYTFKIYPGASHSFTNSNATAVGNKFNIPIAYNQAADTASWNDMKEFLGGIFQ